MMRAQQNRSSETSGAELTREALKRVLEAYAPRLSVRRVEEGVSADFIVHHASGQIAVDVMPLQWKVQKLVPVDQRQHQLRRNVVASAQREWHAGRRPPVEVLVRFDDARPMRPTEVRPLARALCGMVEGMVPGVGELLSMPWPPTQSRGETPPVLAVAVCRTGTPVKSLFRVASPPADYPDLQPADIEAALTRHAQARSQRLSRAHPRWLILLVNTALPSTRCRVFDEPLVTQYRCQLERLFLMQEVPPALQELHVAERRTLASIVHSPMPQAR